MDVEVVVECVDGDRKAIISYRVFLHLKELKLRSLHEVCSIDMEVDSASVVRGERASEMLEVVVSESGHRVC